MATIHGPNSPVARCRVCGAQRQMHMLSHIPWSHDRDHAFEAETVADFEPGDLSVEQLVTEIFAHEKTPRAVACGKELHHRVRLELGVDVEDLTATLGASAEAF